MGKNYYNTLGIERHSSDEEIKRAYRRLALKYHPDKNKQIGAEERFKEIAEAYEVLSDPNKRAAFDKYGDENCPRRGQGGGSSRRHSEDRYYRPAAPHFHPSDPFDLFRSFFENHDPFHDPFHDPMNGFFPRQDVFHPGHHSKIHVSIFDDLPAGTSTCSTTFKTGDGGTVHITRTVIGGDGKVRREMRFRTPSSQRPNHDHHDTAGWSRHGRSRQHSDCDGRPRARQPSRSAPHMEERGQPDGASEGYQRSSSSHPNPPISPKKRPESSGWSRPRQQCESTAGQRLEPEPPRSRPRHRSHVRQSSGTRRDQHQRRERSCDTANTGCPISSDSNGSPGMTCPMCDGRFATSLIEEHAAVCGGHVTSPTRHVSCPICTEDYPHNLIERHAATCGEGVTC